MIHRAPFGSVERFVAILIEHCGGNFPLWLSPEQIVILPISDKYKDYAESVYSQLLTEDIRGYIDHRDEKIGKKIRDAEVTKIPYMIVIGEKEVAENKLSIRKHGEGDQGSVTIPEFIALFKEEIQKALQPSK
jgi:threonyl-tRNA synthetase